MKSPSLFRSRLAVLAALLPTFACTPAEAPEDAPDPAFALEEGGVRHVPALDSLVFEARVLGDAASVAPTPLGRLDGAPILAYVWTTDLRPEQVGFDAVDGTVALAVTSHPDFDDTPLWDENGNRAYDDDGVVYHPHWVVLVEDPRAPAGLAVREATAASTLPPTAPMPMYMDSPGFQVIEDGAWLRVIVPLDRVRRPAAIDVQVLTARLAVDAAHDHPIVAVQEILSEAPDVSPLILHDAPASAWPAPVQDYAPDDLRITDAAVTVVDDLDLLVFEMGVAGCAGCPVPTPAGGLDGAPVLGYVFPTSLPPRAVGFGDLTGTLALVVSSHPDFDDTPLWDENLDGSWDNDGATYHVHWVVLNEHADAGAGLAVTHAPRSALPPTAPMDMAMDAPGFHAFASGQRLRVLVPIDRVSGILDFAFDAVTAEMTVEAHGHAHAILVDRALSILSGDLSLPGRPTHATSTAALAQ